MVGILVATVAGACSGSVGALFVLWAGRFQQRLSSKLSTKRSVDASWPPNLASERSARKLWPVPLAAPSFAPVEVVAPASSDAVPTASDGKFYVLRLPPGAELKSSLRRCVQDLGVSAAAVVTCVGSLTSATLRMASADRDSGDETVKFEERFEICSLVGTLEAASTETAELGSCHLHISLADKDGRVIGGHVVGDCRIFTTAEIVIMALPALRFRREHDDRTGFGELSVTAM